MFSTVHAGIVNIERVATEESLGTHRAGVGEEAGKVNTFHVVPREAASSSREYIAELAVERLPAASWVRVLPHILPQVLVRCVG